MSVELPSQAFDRPSTLDNASIEELELLECLRKIGKGLIASGTAVGVVENTLTLVISPHKFVSVTALNGQPHDQRV